MSFEHNLFHDLGRVAFAMGAGRRFGRGRHGRDFGMWGPGPGAGWPGERRTRRGDVKYAILDVLAEQPRHGYDVIRALEERRSGSRPSAGSIYPTLQLLEDEGCVTSQQVDGKRIYTITEAGRTLLAQKPAESPDEDDDEAHAGRHQLRESAFRLGAAVWQAARDGDPAVLAKVRDVLDRARREVYALLGGDSV
jgi:DNA-binding PadR family transcriptional regulator